MNEKLEERVTEFRGREVGRKGVTGLDDTVKNGKEGLLGSGLLRINWSRSVW